MIFERAVALYDGCCDRAREACVMWILIAKRIGFNKDARRMIAKMVWEGRSENVRDITTATQREKCSLM